METGEAELKDGLLRGGTDPAKLEAAGRPEADRALHSRARPGGPGFSSGCGTLEPRVPTRNLNISLFSELKSPYLHELGGRTPEGPLSTPPESAPPCPARTARLVRDAAGSLNALTKWGSMKPGRAVKGQWVRDQEGICRRREAVGTREEPQPQFPRKRPRL